MHTLMTMVPFTMIPTSRAKKNAGNVHECINAFCSRNSFCVYKRTAFPTFAPTTHSIVHGVSHSKRVRFDSDERISVVRTAGIVRPVDVDGTVVTHVLEELERMCVSGLSIQKSREAVWITVADVVQWSANGQTHTQEFFGRSLLWTGLEDSYIVLSHADLHVMAQTISGLMRGCIFSDDVDLSINRHEARMLGGRKKIGSNLAFVRGDCNMKLGKVITCEDGSKVDEISFALLLADEKDFFLTIKLPFFCFYNLCVNTEKTIIEANWDGFGSAP